MEALLSAPLDGSVSGGGVEDELVVILYCNKDNSSEEISVLHKVSLSSSTI